MIEEPKPLTIKKNWKRPSKTQIKAFENIPTGFVTDALDGEGTLSIDIKPVGDGRDINCVVVGAAVTAGNNAADGFRSSGMAIIIIGSKLLTYWMR